MQDKPTSGLAIATLVTTFLFAPAAYFLAYFGAKEIASGQKSGRGLITASLILLGVLPVLMITGALAYFGLRTAGVITGAVLALVIILGTYTINKMMKEQYFNKAVVIVYLIIFMLIAPATIATVGYFGIIDSSPEVSTQQTSTGQNGLTGPTCETSSWIPCEGLSLEEQRFSVTVHNQLETGIEIHNVTAESAGQQTTCEYSPDALAHGSELSITCDFGAPYEQRDAQFTIAYNEEQETVWRTLQGRIN